ncbi:MAG: asparagine--tRNA ligase [Kiritimatiellia bacterium]
MKNRKEYTAIGALAGKAGETVCVRGWLFGRRSGGKVIFLLVRDGTGVCQCVVEAAAAEAFAAAEKMPHECSLTVRGAVRLDERAAGGVEIAAEQVELIQGQEDFPISRKAHGIDFLLNHRHLWLRSPRQCAILKIRHTLIREIRRFFDDRGFTLIDTPILTPGAAEGAGSLFPVEYFGEEVYLAQTGQLYVESAAMALGKVYCFGPTFRAEKSKTRRHLTEFWMVEPEIAFAELPDLKALAEEMICQLVSAVLEKHAQDLAVLERDIAPLKKIVPPFPHLTYSQAVDLLHSGEMQKNVESEIERTRVKLQENMLKLSALEAELPQAGKKWKQDKLTTEIQDVRENVRELESFIEQSKERLKGAAGFKWGSDLGGDEETLLCRYFDKPVIVTEYPREAKAFYMKQSPSDPRTVLNMDVLAPEGYGEIIGGSQREDDLNALIQRMKDEKMDPAPYEWYLDLRRYGSVPHGGYGLGVERTLAWICGLKHIREAIPFPRLMGRIYP